MKYHGVVKKTEITISSNQVDRHGDVFAKSALEDTFLKNKLTALIQRQRQKSKEQLVVFSFTVTHKGKKLLVQTIIDNPDELKLDEFFQKGIYKLDKISADYFNDCHKLSRVVFLYDKNGLHFLYAVRKDGYPVSFEFVN